MGRFVPLLLIGALVILGSPAAAPAPADAARALHVRLQRQPPAPERPRPRKRTNSVGHHGVAATPGAAPVKPLRARPVSTFLRNLLFLALVLGTAAVARLLIAH